MPCALGEDDCVIISGKGCPEPGRRNEFIRERSREQECFKPGRIRRKVLGGRVGSESHLCFTLFLLVTWASSEKSFVCV